MRIDQGTKGGHCRTRIRALQEVLLERRFESSLPPVEKREDKVECSGQECGTKFANVIRIIGQAFDTVRLAC